MGYANGLIRSHDVLTDPPGDISSLTVFGQTMVIVNSVKVAEDLLDVRGANFSDRPVIPMGGELMGFKNALSMSQHGDRVRKERKLFHQLFGTQSSIKQFVPIISSEICKLLQNVLRKPRSSELAPEIERSVQLFGIIFILRLNAVS